jgi:hypothetical protein
MDDDDIDVEWAGSPDTVIDTPITAPHAILELPGYDVGRKDGCRACCQSCQEEVMRALIVVAGSKGLTRDEIANLIAAVRCEMVPT